jgi:phenylpropionate dioxygenase-like ring-hydroxylating dioxygenase large terminal subunit
MRSFSSGAIPPEDAKEHRMSGATRQRGAKAAEIARGVPAGLELGLRNYWYPVLRSETLPPGQPLAFKVLNEALVAWRDAAGRPCVARDKCPHRGVKLSAGRVLEGELQCAWHGLRFDAKGACRLIPWEPEDSRLLAEVKLAAYPAAELGGWIWSYIGDPAKFPPPPLEDVVPEELLRPEEFILFMHPVDVWNANWLQALDGSDGYHAVTLHSESQPKTSMAGTAVPSKPAGVPLAERRTRLVPTPQGLRALSVDGDGKPIHHGHFMEGWRGERWTLPGLFTVPIQPAPHLPAYVARLYQFAIDATHTQSSRWVAMCASTDEERARCRKLWDEVVGPRQRQVMAEDKLIIESLGDLAESRAEEYLFHPDQDVLAVRRMMADAWIAQQGGARPMPAKEAFVFPY